MAYDVKLFPYVEQGKYGARDENRNVIIPLIYEDLYSFIDNGTALAKLNNYYGIINYKNEIVIPFIYEELYQFSEGRATTRARLKGKWGHIDREGKEIIPIIFDAVSRFTIKGNFVTVTINTRSLDMDKELNYYRLLETGTRVQIPCETCKCYNDLLMTKLCCQFKT